MQFKSILIFLVVSWVLNSQALTNALPMDNYSDVVRLKFSNGWVCTGVYVDKFTILTAAHCLPFGDDVPIPQLSEVQSENDKIIKVKQVKLIPHPDFKNQFWHSHDVGLIKTTEYKEFANNFQLATSTAFAGNIQLYGCGRIDSTKKEYFRGQGKNKFIRVGDILFFKGKTKNESESLGSFSSVAPNDSGGPIADEKSKKIIGVMTTTTLKQSAQLNIFTVSTGTSITSPSNLTFIQSNLGMVSE